MNYEELIKRIVKKGFTFSYVLEEDLYGLKITTEELNELKQLLDQKDIRILTRDEKTRSPLVRDLDYGELKSIGYEHTDKPRYSEIEYRDGQVISEDYEELDYRIETELIPNAVHTVYRSGRGYAINVIALNDITKMKLSDEELKHVIEYLQELDIVVRGISHDLDDIDNYESVATYHYKDLPPALTNQDNDMLIRQYKSTKNHDILNKIIVGNMRLVIYVASKIFKRNRTIDFDDLVAAGYEKLQTIIENFDVNMGYTFATYAIPSLEGYMKREIEESYVYSAHVNSMVIKYRKTKDALEKQMGNNYTDYDIAEILEIPVDRVRELAQCDVANREKEEYANNVITGMDDVEKYTFLNLLRGNLKECIESLTDREQLVLKLRFGLDGNEPMTLEQVGNIMSCSKERIRQVEAKALRKLRHPVRSRLLKDYVDIEYSENKSIVDGLTEEQMDDYNYGDEFVDPETEMTSKRNY